MRPIIRGNTPKDSMGAEIQFKEYQHARGELIRRLGEYCSYCEMHLDASLAVEHVQPVKPEGTTSELSSRKLDWNNFLLACTNCNSTKSNTEILLEDYFWPDRDNTFLVLKYSKGGIVEPGDTLSPEDRIRALNTIQLMGLDKTPLKNPAESDRRWQNRREAWELAEESRKDLRTSDTPEMRRQIARSVKANGFWSVWMTVFSDDSDMLRRFIETFPGTCNACFDSQSSFAPVPRSAVK